MKLPLAACAAPFLIPCAAVPPAASSTPPDPPAASAPAPASENAAVLPVPRTDAAWIARHESFNARAVQGAKKGDIGIIFLGDSITHGWEGAGREVWERFYAPRRAVNFGISGDRTQHVLWRLQHGNLDGLAQPAEGEAPRLVVLMIGTNNSNGADHTAEEIAAGIGAVVGEIRERLPRTKVLLLAIFPRGEKPSAQRDKNARASELASRLADGKMVHFLDIGAAFTETDGTISGEIMPDYLHLSPKGYQRWAEAMEPTIRELLGETGGGDAAHEQK